MPADSVAVKWKRRFYKDDEFFQRPPLAYLVRRDEGALPVVLNAAVLDELLGLPQSASDHVGLLLGVAADDSVERFLVIGHCIKFQNLVPEFTTKSGAELFARFESICAERHPQLQILGWYRCRPKGRLQLSVPEEKFHKDCFDQGHHICLLVDSGNRCAVVYSWEQREDEDKVLQGPRGFYLCQPGERYGELVPESRRDRSAPAESEEPAFSTEYAVAGQATWKYRPAEAFRRRPPARPTVSTLTSEKAAGPAMGILEPSTATASREESATEQAAAAIAATDVPEAPTKTEQLSPAAVLLGRFQELLEPEGYSIAFGIPNEGETKLLFVVKAASAARAGDNALLVSEGAQVRIDPDNLESEPDIFVGNVARKYPDPDCWEKKLQIPQDEVGRLANFIRLVLKEL